MNDFERLKIMVVDDSVHMRALVRTILQSLGVNSFWECADGVEALEALKHFDAHILITDWLMEPLHGVELVRLLRTSDDSPNRFLSIIMMTGHSTRINVMQARDAGVDEFISKPISARSLYDRVNAVVNNTRIFVRSSSFFGPDRRRTFNKSYTKSDRRKIEAETVDRDVTCI